MKPLMYGNVWRVHSRIHVCPPLLTPLLYNRPEASKRGCVAHKVRPLNAWGPSRSPQSFKLNMV